MHLKFVEDKKGKYTQSMCINKKGYLKFNPKYVETLNQEEIIGAITHEVMHCALQHFERKGFRGHELFNISSDLVVNNLLVKDGVTIPECSLVPHNDGYEYAGYEVKNLHEKTSEEVYDELYRHLSDKFKRDAEKIKSYIDKQKDKGFDDHDYDSNGDGDGESEGNKPDNKGKGNGKGNEEEDDNPFDGSGIPKDDDEVDWGEMLVNAYAYAKSQGKAPAGMERIIGKLNETYIDWRGILYRYIQNQVPIDYTYARPHKKSHSLGFYNPAIVKEEVDVYLAVDTSGSISPSEFNEFVSEILGIVNSFACVNLTIIVCDCRIHDIFEAKKVSPKDVISKVKFKGGGGTSHIPVFDWLRENKPQAKLLIAFTDGYTDFPDNPNINTLWVLAGSYRASKKHFPFGKVIELPEK